MRMVIAYLFVACAVGIAAFEPQSDLPVLPEVSFEDFIFVAKADRDDACRFARSEPPQHLGGFDLEFDHPLDFSSVSEHTFFLGLVSQSSRIQTIRIIEILTRKRSLI